MRHNLPAPSQAWGTDIDKRIASLESRLRLAESQIGNTTNSISSLTSERAINGVAQPFVHRDYKTNLILPDNQVSSNPVIWSYPISWGMSGSYMSVSISGNFSVPLLNGAQVLPGDFELVTSIDGKYGVPFTTAVGRGRILVGSFSYTMVLNYSDNLSPVAQLSLRGWNILDNLASDHNNSYLEVVVAGVRY